MTPEWCPRVHAEEDRPRYASGIENPYVCCDRQIEMGVRRAEKCEPTCPWQSGSEYVRECWDMMSGALILHPAYNRTPAQYELDILRFEFVLKAYLVPRREWRLAWDIARYLTHGLNTPAFEAD